jgi:hypothetical protein
VDHDLRLRLAALEGVDEAPLEDDVLAGDAARAFAAAATSAAAVAGAASGG